MTNRERPEDASPHYYGDNFPNCETSNFDYIRHVRRLGGKVIFEFWELPPWAKARDAAGKPADAPEIEPYVRAMVRYCQVSREKTGHAPEIVGIQNEVTQSAADWKKMASALRRGLDAAGFAATKIHTHNPPTSVGGVAAAGAFREDPASNLYDYQSLFHDPDGYETRLADLRAASGEKPFLAVELCVINGDFQTRGYRVAFAMGQLYHKRPTQLNVGAALYCRTPLNGEQPSYGWTRTLFAPDAEHGMKPVASDHQLRILGAYTRRVREGMKRVKAASSHPHVPATAFAGAGGAALHYREAASTQRENAVEAMPGGAGGRVEVRVAPGSIVTLTNVELGKVIPDVRGRRLAYTASLPRYIISFPSNRTVSVSGPVSSLKAISRSVGARRR
jgi:hypothetical protein